MSGFNFFDMLGWSPLSPRINWPPPDDSGIPAWMRDELVGGGGDDAPGRAMTQKQRHEAEIAAGIRTTLPPDTQFNSKGFAISPDLSDTLQGQRISAPVLRPELGRGTERNAAPPSAFAGPAAPGYAMYGPGGVEREAGAAPPPAAAPVASAPVASAPAAPAPAGPVPRSLSPELYRPLDLRSTMPDPAAPPPAPAAPGPAIVPPAVPGAAPQQGPLAKPPGLPAAAVPGVLAGQRPGLGGIFGGLFGGGGMTGPDGKELTTDQMMDKLLRMQLQKAMQPNWGAMAAAFAEAGKPSLLPTGGMGAALGKAAAAMDSGGGKDAFAIMKTMQEVQDLKSKAASRKELSDSLKKLNERLAARGSGVQVNTTTGAVTPSAGGGASATAPGAPPVKVEPLSGEAAPADSSYGDYGGGGDAIPDAGGTHPVDIIPKYESGGRNIEQQVVGPSGGYNPSVGRVTGPSSASGYWQMLDSTYRNAAAKTAPVQIGDEMVDPTRFRRAMHAPYEVQREVAKTLYNERGYADWAPYNKNLRAALARGEGPPSGGPQLASADDRVRIQPLAGEAQPAGGGGAGYDDALALLLAQIGAQSQLAGLGDVAKPYETYLYNRPEYKGAVEGAQTRARKTEEEPFDIRKEQRGEGTQTRIEELKDRLGREAKEAEQRRQADLTIAPREQWPDDPATGRPRPITVGELAQRYRYFGPQAAPVGPAPVPLAAPSGPIAPSVAASTAPGGGGGGMGVGGALPMARPMATPAAAPGPADAGGLRYGPPGREDEAKARAAANVKRETEYRDAADAAKSTKAALLGISSALDNVVKGPFANWAQNFATWGQVLDPNNPNFKRQVANFTEANSAVNELVRKAVRQSDPNPTFLQTKMAIESMPVAMQAEGGSTKITNRMLGLQNHDIARAALLDQYMAQNNNSSSGFDAWWRQRASPFAFIYSRMDPDDKRQVAVHLSRTEAGRREMAALADQVDFITKSGLEQ